MQAVNAAGPMNSVTDIIRQDCMILPTASIIRASAYADVDGFDPELQGYEDDDLFFRIFRAGWSSLYVPEPLAAFRIHRESSSRSASFRKSRMRYFEKIVAELPDDVQLNRYYITDHMQPRMLASTLFDYAKALRVKDDAEARAIVGDLNRLLTWANNGGTPRTRIRLGLFVMRLPRLARGLLAVRATLPPWMRPRVPPVLLRS
jgi:GT2 family glycosyltransferase